ncbi:MAG: ABC transporter ATP-binding protein [Clostridiales bacterium]|nr:ABC transporter ATP-binding protein [Clostridiales bacterium]
MKIFANTRRLIVCGDRKSRYILQLVMVVTIGLLDIAAAHALGKVTKNLTATGGESLPASFAYLAVAIILAAMLEWYRSVRMTRLTETAESNYRKITARALLHAEYDGLQRMESGDLISRTVADCRFAASNSEHLINGIRSVLVPVMLVIIMFLVDWRVGIGYSVPLALVLIYPRLTKKSLSEIPAYRRAFAAMNAQAKDLIQNRTTVKAYRLQNKADEWVEETVEDYRKKGIRGIGKIYTANISALVINVLPLFGCAIVGAWLLFVGGMSAEGFVIAVMLASTATEELLRLPNVLVNFPSGVVAADRLFELWDLPEETGGEETGGGGAAVVFDHVSFRYAEQDENDPPLLNDLSFTVQPGEKIALVGHSGCGKSTVIKLITGLYRPQVGTVKVLGSDVRSWDLEKLRQTMGVLQQDTFVFRGSVKDNILLGDTEADDFTLAIAMDNAKLSKWVSQQENGWNADTGEHGGLLSGGLKQRVGLARLFLKDAPIELMDEATSALDACHQKEILQALRESGDGKTRITIAHRLSSITDADRILFLHEGRIAEEGTHGQLLKKRGLYYGLYTAQEKEEQDGE